MKQFCKVCLLLYFVIFSIIKVYGIEKTDSLYKVLKIKSTKDYYIIYAQRNDSLFKIISKKVILKEKPNLRLLEKGKYYYFNFGNNDADSKISNVEPLKGIMNHLDIKSNNTFFESDTKIKFTKTLSLSFIYS